MAGGGKHIWHVIRCGGSDQVDLRTGDDLLHLKELDKKLWAALSCPIAGIRMDPGTLALLDSDHDKRIRVPELLSAIDWMAKRLNTLDGVFAGTESVPLSSIRDDTEEGKAIRQTAAQVLHDLGKPSVSEITLDDVQDTERIFSNTLLNGDGILPPEQVKDESLAAILTDIATCVGTVQDRGALRGIGGAQADLFFKAVHARLEWKDLAKGSKEIFPLGDKTETAAQSLSKVREKIDDYFTRCSLAAYDDRSASPLNRTDNDYAAFAQELLSDASAEISTFPLSQVSATDTLRLGAGINPFWKKDIAQAVTDLFQPLDVGNELSLSRWKEIKSLFAPYYDWMAKEAGKEVASLADDRLAALSAEEPEKKVRSLIADDWALAPTYDRITDIVQLILYHAHLMEILRNMVNMSLLYDPNTVPLFCVGTLYLDARQCSLCFQVDNPATHVVGARKGKCSMVYCEVIQPAAGKKMNICVPITAGSSRSLSVGRHGVFFDLEGHDWDATVLKVIDHPINLREAFWAPWRKIAEMLSGQIAKFLANKQTAIVNSVATKTTAAVVPPAGKPSAPTPQMEGTALASSVAAIGIAVGLVGSAFGGLMSTVTSLPLWKTLLGVVCVFLLVSMPSVILTWFKLRARDLAPILNAGGWAVNIRLGFSLRLGRIYTTCAELPKGTKRSLVDPYADRKKWPYVLIAIVLSAAIAFAICYFLPDLKTLFGNLFGAKPNV